MTHSNDQRRAPGGKLPGGLGCLAILLLSILVMAALSVAVGFSNRPQDDQSLMATAEGRALTQFDNGSATTEAVLSLAPAESSVVADIIEVHPSRQRFSPPCDCK